jgi:ATP-dependent protease La (LON) substrate-binding domain
MSKLPPQINTLPVRALAVLPSGRFKFNVGREASKHALQNALKSQNRIAIFPQLDADLEQPTVADLHAIGTLCHILSPQEYVVEESTVAVVVHGLQRIRISKVIQSSPYLIIEPVEVADAESKTTIALPPIKDIQEAVSTLSKYRPELKLDELGDSIPYLGQPGGLADFLIKSIRPDYDTQLTFLLELNPRKRLKRAYEVLVREGQQAQLESEINEQVTQSIKDEHRQLFLRAQLKTILEELGENAPVGLHDPIFRGKSFKVVPDLSFVLMPFAEMFRPIYDEIVKPVVEQFGLKCIRADDLYGSKAIIEDIWRLINEAKIIIADVTGKNPNVFYEIGLAHAIGKEVIIISQTMDDVPFDLRHLRCLIYRDSVAGFRKLEAQLQQALSTIDGLVKMKPEG